MQTPIIAKMRGLRKAPIMESSAPRNQIIQPKTGIQPVTRATIERINPAVPKPFVLRSCMMF